MGPIEATSVFLNIFFPYMAIKLSTVEELVKVITSGFSVRDTPFFGRVVLYIGMTSHTPS